jgi:hypothetical protein
MDGEFNAGAFWGRGWMAHLLKKLSLDEAKAQLLSKREEFARDSGVPLRPEQGGYLHGAEEAIRDHLRTIAKVAAGFPHRPPDR